MINNFEFIYLPIMDEFYPMVYLFNPNHKWNSSIWNHSSMDIFIHVGGLKSHLALSSNLKAPSSGFTFMHKPSSFLVLFCAWYILMLGEVY